MSVRVLVVALVLQLVLGAALIFVAVNGFSIPGVDDAVKDAQRAPVATAHRFDGLRAMSDVRAQVALGPRPAGSPALERLARRLRAELPNGRFEPVPGGLTNVVGSLPGRKPAILLAAHYDTKDQPGFVGANDGAGGVAVVLGVARALRAGPRPADAPAIDFAFLDGEETPRGTPDKDFVAKGLRGSKADAARRAPGDTRAMILADFVGQRGLRIEREANSDRSVWARLRRAARKVGAGAVFPAGTAEGIYDDHIPYLRRGIPSIDLIDFDYPCYHRACDRPDRLDVRSLDATGETLVELLQNWR
jgi:glutaminyl-peptide cyclotransferase